MSKRASKRLDSKNFFINSHREKRQKCENMNKIAMFDIE